MSALESLVLLDHSLVITTLFLQLTNSSLMLLTLRAAQFGNLLVEFLVHVDKLF